MAILGLRIRIPATKRTFLQVYGRSIGLRQALRRGLPSATLANQTCEDEDFQGTWMGLMRRVEPNRLSMGADPCIH